MNAPHSLQQIAVQPPPAPLEPRNDEINLVEYWDIIVDSRWLIATVTAVAVAIGAAYAFLANPVFEANLLIQVEDSQSSAKSFLGEASSLFDVKTPATAEMEIIRSRMIIGKAVDNTLLYITAKPKHLPLVGDWLARRAKTLSDPGPFGWVTGNESIKVNAFDVPDAMEATKFTLKALGNGQYELGHSGLDAPLRGTVGQLLKADTPEGTISLLVQELNGKPGAAFALERHSRLDTIERLQDKLKLSEKGRQSGVIDATLQDGDRFKLTTILNAIGQEYVRQNVERKAAEAQKTLSFLDVQLPQFKKQLDDSEDAYNKYRNQKGTVSLDDEAKLILTQSVDLQGKLLEAQQKRRELISRFTPEHPSVKTLDAQIAAWNKEIETLNAQIKRMPSVQQEAVRLERDVKVNNELYAQLRNNALQLQLIREGKIGNARLIDSAALPEEPVRPKRILSLSLSVLLGLLGGIAFALTRASFFRGVRSPQEIEIQTGLNVYSTVPLSNAQLAIAQKVASKQPGMHILTEQAPRDAAVEALRSLRTALQFTMLEASNNLVLITGATPGVGKSFISANFSAVLASGGKRILLIDADLRKGHLNQYFGFARESGLYELISGTINESKAIRRNVLPNLDVLPTGAYPPNPAEVVVSGAFAKLLEQVSSRYDLIIIDSAPVLVAADTLSIATHVGALFLVARAEKTYIGDMHESARRLSHSGKAVTGVLFNGLDLTRRHYGKYGYRYGHYQYGGYKYQREAYGMEASR